MTMRHTLGRSAAPGLTLIEVMASLVILSLLTVTGGAWIVGESRAVRSLNTSISQTVALARSLDALRGDLAESAPGSITEQVDQNTMTMTTARAAPGAAPGWREVTWRLNQQTNVLERSEHRLNDADREAHTNAAIFDVAVLTLDMAPPTLSDDEPPILSIRIELSSGAAAGLSWRIK